MDAGDRGVKMVKTGDEGLGDELVLAQDSVGKLNGFKVSVGSKGGSGGGRGSIERNF